MESAQTTNRSMGAWILSVLLAIVFLAAGVPKLLGTQPLLLQATAMPGFPDWIRVVVGVVEVACAILLLVPRLAAGAAGTLALLMIPATITHLVTRQPGAWVPVLLFIVLIALSWMRSTTGVRHEWAGIAERPHPVLREGVMAGLIGGSCIAVWFLVVDVLAGHPLYTPATLGRGLLAILGPLGGVGEGGTVAIYTVFHYVAFIVVGIIVAAVIRMAADQPALLLGFFILFVMFEVGFYGMVSLLANSTFGSLAWYQVMIGNLIAAVAMGLYLWKVHPALGADFAHALDGRD